MKRWLGKFYLWIFGWTLKGQKPAYKKCLLLAVPHTSNWDVPVMLSMSYIYGIRVSWIGKHTLFQGPLGPLMRWIGGVPVDRRARHNAVQQMVDEFARRDELYLMITPEITHAPEPALLKTEIVPRHELPPEIENVTVPLSLPSQSREKTVTRRGPVSTP